MAFKDILVHVDNSAQASVRLGLAARLAQAEGAHLVGLHVRWRPQLPPVVAAQLAAEVAEMQAHFNQIAADEARAAFDREVGDRVASGAGFTAEWRDQEGDLVDTLALHARYADLTVIGQAADEDDNRPLADPLVLEVGRPVLVVPYAGRFDSAGQRVLVAWNGSREATRAVHDALPLLKRAKRVLVLVVNADSGHGDVPGADLCLHLSRHGVNAVAQQVRADELEVGELLLSRAADEGADLLVMGAYGRSRLRELVLGGTTRHILRHMTVPVLLSH